MPLYSRVVSWLNMVTAEVGWIYKSQDPSVISSHSYPNCWMCFVVELKFFYRVGFDVIHKGCRLGEFVLMLSYFGCWILCVWSVDIDISYWSWTNFIVDLNNKCWCWQQFDWLYFAPLRLPYPITFSWTWPQFFFHRISTNIYNKSSTSILCSGR